MWTSNYPQNNIATGTVGGSAPDGAFALYSLPHGLTTDSGLYCDDAEDPIPIECYQNDGLKVESETGDTLYAFGGRIDTANSGKVTFLLDGVDINGNNTDNIDNWQREGDWADNWAFVGVRALHRLAQSRHDCSSPPDRQVRCPVSRGRSERNLITGIATASLQ